MNEFSLSLWSVLTLGTFCIGFYALWANYRRRVAENQELTEYTRYLYEQMKQSANNLPLSEQEKNLSLSLSLGQDELSGSSCPPFFSWHVFGQEKWSKTN